MNTLKETYQQAHPNVTITYNFDSSGTLLKQLKELPTLSGKMGFDEKGDRVGDFYRIYKVNNAGKFELQAR